MHIKDSQISKQSTISQVLNVMSKEDCLKRTEENFEALSFSSHGMVFQFGIAHTLEEKIQAYQLVYANYYEREYIDFHSSKLWFTHFDAHPNTITLTIKHNEKVIACITVIPDTALGLPADKLYQKELDDVRISNQRIVEITGLAVDKKYSHIKDIVSFITNLSLSTQNIFKNDVYFITVNPKHKIFYQRKFQFKQIGNEKSYIKVNGAPAVLLQLTKLQRNTEMAKPVKERSSRLLYKNYLSRKIEKKVMEKLKENLIPLSCKKIFYLFYKIRPVFQALKRNELHEILGYYERERLTIKK